MTDYYEHPFSGWVVYEDPKEQLKEVKIMNVKFKRLHPNAVIPAQGTEGDTGFDMVATSMEVKDDYVEYGTGIAVQVQPGYAFETRARSSVSKYDLMLANGVGTIDNGYQGEIKFRFKINRPWYRSPFSTKKPKLYNIGDRIGQIMIEKTYKIKWQEVSQFVDVSQRGAGGFGSTDKVIESNRL